MELCYLISYDLCQPDKSYDSLYDTVRRFPKWARLTDSFWAVISTATASDIRDYLLRFIDENDRIIVIRSGRIAAWNNIIASNE